VKLTGRCPKCGSTSIEYCPSVRAGGGPLSVGKVAADAFTVFSQFDAYVCLQCGYTEFYRKMG
jgi:predicted nucleic-acid-binding Zn-ribbon protein